MNQKFKFEDNIPDQTNNATSALYAQTETEKLRNNISDLCMRRNKSVAPFYNIFTLQGSLFCQIFMLKRRKYNSVW